MTLIECFTDSHIDNIASCLRLRPQKMILVGEADKMKAPIRHYEALLRRRQQSTSISSCDISGMDIRAICNALDKLIRQQDECIIDLTGGEELVIMAVGAVLARLDQDARRHVRVEKYDHTAHAIRDCIRDNRILPHQQAMLTVDEMISIHGGTVLPAAVLPDHCDYQDLDGLWKIVSDAPREWNRAIAVLNEFESRCNDQAAISLSLDNIRGGISNFDAKETLLRNLLEKFHRHNIVDNRSSRDRLDYEYRTPLLRYCTQKAGNVLEVKTLLEARSVLKDGKPFFNDCAMGVHIDWDGTVHSPEDRIPETRNEIDVLLMHGCTPLFVSCKNGRINDEELYKLHTVATRFGGPHARKMLVATDLDQKSPMANRAFIQRAWDMDIFLVTDAADLSHEEWQHIFQNAIQ